MGISVAIVQKRTAAESFTALCRCFATGKKILYFAQQLWYSTPVCLCVCFGWRTFLSGG
jgi:hypothetical protein